MRAHGHPALLQALKRLKYYEDFIEKHAPLTKKSGLFFFDSVGLARPEIVRHRNIMSKRYSKPKEAQTLLFVPQTRMKPFHKSRETKDLLQLHNFGENLGKIHVCFYAAPFGVIPLELDEVYPLSQHETATPLDKETITYVANEIVNYINRTSYKTVILLNDPENWNKTIPKMCKKACQQKNMKFKTYTMKEARNLNMKQV
jgi:7-cyano-7-deazaguanine tRNA-ribosyltransferase